MKYATARFVSGFCAVFFICWAIEIFIYDIGNYNRLFKADFLRYMGRDAIMLAFGIFCLIRFRYWHKRAIYRDKQDRADDSPKPRTPYP